MLEEGLVVIEPDEESHTSANELEVMDAPNDEPDVVNIPDEPEENVEPDEMSNTAEGDDETAPGSNEEQDTHGKSGESRVR
jgi:hypothetical protein